MNKLLIGLLIIAAGAGAFFLLRKKKDTVIADHTLHKEWILGKWKLDAGTPLIDSTHPNRVYYFQDKNVFLGAVSDTAKADTSHYEWTKANELVIKKGAADSTGHVYAVTKLTADSLQLQNKDSVSYLFLRAK